MPITRVLNRQSAVALAAIHGAGQVGVMHPDFLARHVARAHEQHHQYEYREWTEGQELELMAKDRDAGNSAQ